MEKMQQFYEKINKALADKYQTTPKIIGSIRGFVIQNEIGFTEYLDFVESKLAIFSSSYKRKLFYMDIYVFIRKLSDEKWKDVTEKIEYRN